MQQRKRAVDPTPRGDRVAAGLVEYKETIACWAACGLRRHGLVAQATPTQQQRRREEQARGHLFHTLSRKKEVR
jgi:hypothetical protein